MSAEQVRPSEWALVLSDWKRVNADVTVHLRGGVSLGPGRVSRIPGPGLDAAELHDPRALSSNPSGYRCETKWTFDLSEVAAITAEAAQ